MVIESGFLSFRNVREKGRVIVKCRWVEFLFNILAYWGRGLLRAWSMGTNISGNTEVDCRLEDNPVVAGNNKKLIYQIF